MLARVGGAGWIGLRFSQWLNPTTYGAGILVTLKLEVADLAATRFAMSPLFETLRAVPLLARPGHSSVNQAWVRWARAELERRPLGLPLLWPLLASDRPWWPEFLFPAPVEQVPRSR